MLGWLIAFIIVVTLIIIADLKINDFEIDDEDEKKNYKGQKSRENDIIVNLEKFINSREISREN